ncbi:MAG: MBOAT family protein [Gammaproteobacteria bacterium]|nr:MBOAT family protein [Gammaproteobacteria bacterium]
MLFNSYEFIFLFLPVTFLVFFAMARLGREAAIAWLVIASLFFYGWWNPSYLVLILLSMVINFAFGEFISRAYEHHRTARAKIGLALGVTLNLGTLAYFKYAGFFFSNINALTGSSVDIGHIVLPLAISFFTFQQIAYLADAYKGITQEYRFSHYALFVTFFPQLIAGPIVHHKEMLPQFMRRDTLRPKLDNVSIGLSIFFIGLFKKAVLADGVAPYGSSVFDAAAAGETLSFFVAWGGALAYTMQLYFDFSGYSDMAIGGARLFGIRLPLNFHSPYKATSIIEFWRRWHMTLSRFLRDYLYIPLGGSHHGKSRRYFNLMVTMFLGGLWHGAGWTFVAWGGLHGLYLVVNHAWHRFRQMLGRAGAESSTVGKLVAWLITFMAVVTGWVFFRATDFHSAIIILEGMAGINGVALPNAVIARLGDAGIWLQSAGVDVYLGGGSDFSFTWLWIVVLLAMVLMMPNTQQIMSLVEPALRVYQSDDKYEIRLGRRLAASMKWQPAASWAVIIGLVAGLGLLALTSISEFLYFQF